MLLLWIPLVLAFPYRVPVVLLTAFVFPAPDVSVPLSDKAGHRHNQCGYYIFYSDMYITCICPISKSSSFDKTVLNVCFCAKCT